MAKFFPKNLTYHNITKSEELFISKLKEQLNDEYYVFYSHKWIDNTDESESDFIVFHPNKGFICIEVKGGKRLVTKNNVYYIDYGNNEGRELRQSPHSQAEQSMRYLYEQFRNVYNKDFEGIYGFAAAFPFYSFNPSHFDSNGHIRNTINFTDLGNLKQKIEDIFAYFKSKKMGKRIISKDDNEKFLFLVNKDIAIDQIKGGHNTLLSKQIDEITRNQNILIDFISYYDKAIIMGPAGTGKTFLAYNLINKHYNKKTLFVTLNNGLLKHMETYLGNLNYHNNDFKYITFNDVFNYNEKYDLIIIDEGQDLDIEKYEHLRALSNSVYVFLDLNQQREQQKFDIKSIQKILKINYGPFLLTKNVRNTYNIISYLKENFNFDDKYYTNNISGSTPELINIKNDNNLINYINNLLVELIHKEKIDKQNISIIFDTKNYDLYKNIEKELIKQNFLHNKSLLYFENFKGLDNEVIIYINGKNENYSNYISFTRAKIMLYIINNY